MVDKGFDTKETAVEAKEPEKNGEGLDKREELDA